MKKKPIVIDIEFDGLRILDDWRVNNDAKWESGDR